MLPRQAMNDDKDKLLIDAGPASVEFPRRRLGRIVHDERGQASMEWEALDARDSGRAPRQKLQVMDDAQLAELRPQSNRVSSLAAGADPYDLGVTARVKKLQRPRTPEDMRRLNEWIKQKRAVEEKRRLEGG